jgi:hypothetical protein
LSIHLDGEALHPGDAIPLSDDGANHKVEVVLV